jgi:hypothetical protein
MKPVRRCGNRSNHLQTGNGHRRSAGSRSGNRYMADVVETAPVSCPRGCMAAAGGREVSLPLRSLQGRNAAHFLRSRRERPHRRRPTPARCRLPRRTQYRPGTPLAPRRVATLPGGTAAGWQTMTQNPGVVVKQLQSDGLHSMLARLAPRNSGRRLPRGTASAQGHGVYFTPLGATQVAGGG